MYLSQTRSIFRPCLPSTVGFDKKYSHISMSRLSLWWLCIYCCKNLLIIPACDQLWLVAVIISQLDLIHYHSMDPDWWHSWFIMKQQIPADYNHWSLCHYFGISWKGEERSERLRGVKWRHTVTGPEYCSYNTTITRIPEEGGEEEVI